MTPSELIFTVCFPTLGCNAVNLVLVVMLVDAVRAIPILFNIITIGSEDVDWIHMAHDRIQ
jgi:hypothetical protein